MALQVCMRHQAHCAVDQKVIIKASQDYNYCKRFAGLKKSRPAWHSLTNFYSSGSRCLTKKISSIQTPQQDEIFFVRRCLTKKNSSIQTPQQDEIFFVTDQTMTNKYSSIQTPAGRIFFRQLDEIFFTVRLSTWFPLRLTHWCTANLEWAEKHCSYIIDCVFKTNEMFTKVRK